MAELRKAESDFSLDLTNNGEAVFEISGTTEAGQQLSIIEKEDPMVVQAFFLMFGSHLLMTQAGVKYQLNPN